MMFLPTRTRYSESAPYADSIDTIHEDIIDKNFNNQNYSDNLNSNQNLPNQNSISSDYNRNCPHPDPTCSHLQDMQLYLDQRGLQLVDSTPYSEPSEGVEYDHYDLSHRKRTNKCSLLNLGRRSQPFNNFAPPMCSSSFPANHTSPTNDLVDSAHTSNISNNANTITNSPSPQSNLLSPHSPSAGFSDSADEHDSDLISNISDSSPKRPTGIEILLLAGVHYNPVANDGSTNPQWIIVTCDPVLFKFAPLFYKPDNGPVIGALVPRGQLIVSSGQPILNSSAPCIYLTPEESANNRFVPSNIIDSQSIPKEPFSFDTTYEPQDLNLFVNHISNVFNDMHLRCYYQYNHYNVNQNSDVKINSYNQSNKVFNNLLMNRNVSNFLSNWSQNFSNTTNVFCNVNHSDKFCIQSLFSSNASVESHRVDVDSFCTTSKAQVQSHAVDVNNQAIASTALVQNHLVDVIQNNLSTQATVQSHAVDVRNQLISSTANVQNHSVDVIQNNLSTQATVQSHAVDVRNQLTSSTARVEHHHVDVSDKVINSIVEIPKFVVEVKDKVIPLSTLGEVPSLSTAVVQLANRILELTNNLSTQVPNSSSHTETSDSSVVSHDE